MDKISKGPVESVSRTHQRGDSEMRTIRKKDLRRERGWVER